jgi:magnesium-transporting ATPase (P-type)
MGRYYVFTRIKHTYHWQTIVFTVLCFSQMGHVMAIPNDSLFTLGLLSNKPLLLHYPITVSLQLMIIILSLFLCYFQNPAPLSAD